jgi:hypothetical protein
LTDAQRERAYRIGLLAVLALAAFIRIWNLGRFSYWLDEIFQSYLIHAPRRVFWATLRLDAVHPPLDYLIDRGVECLHPSDPARKLTSAAWGTGSIAALAALLRRRGGRTIALLSAALLAGAPFHVRYSQELRPYALGTFLACISLWLVDRALVSRPTFGRATIVFAAFLATAYALYFAAAALGLAAAALVATDTASDDATRRAAARRWTRWSPLFLALLAAAYAPWWGAVREASHRISRGAPGNVLTRARLLLAFFTVSYKQEGWAFGPKALYGAMFSLALALLVAGTIACLRRPRLRFVPIWAFGGIAMLEALRFVSPALGPFRYSLPSGMALVPIIAAGIAALLRRASTRIFGAAALAALLLFQGVALYFYNRNGRYDWNRLVAFLRSRPSSEVIYTSGHNPQYCLAYFLCGPDWLTNGHRCGRPLVDLEGAVSPLNSAVASGRRAWLVLDGMPVSAEPREWSKAYPSILFPEAEGSILKKLGAPSRESVPSPIGLRRPRRTLGRKKTKSARIEAGDPKDRLPHAVGPDVRVDELPDDLSRRRHLDGVSGLGNADERVPVGKPLAAPSDE